MNVYTTPEERARRYDFFESSVLSAVKLGPIESIAVRQFLPQLKSFVMTEESVRFAHELIVAAARLYGNSVSFFDESYDPEAVALASPSAAADEAPESSAEDEMDKTPVDLGQSISDPGQAVSDLPRIL